MLREFALGICLLAGWQQAQAQQGAPAQQDSRPARSSAKTSGSAVSGSVQPSEHDSEAVDRFSQKIHEAFQRPGNEHGQLSPETQKAIADAAQEFVSDPEIKGAIAEKIRQFNPPGHREMMFAMLVPIALFGTIALIAALAYWRSQARIRARMEFQTQLLSKFSSGPELSAFLASEGGRQFLSGASSPQNLRDRIVKRAAVGMGFAVLGLGLIISAIAYDRRFNFLAILFLAFGVGHMIAAATSYHLMKKTDAAQSNSNTLPA